MTTMTTMSTTRITGTEAIDYAARTGATLSKHADPTEGARVGLSLAEARTVAREDAGLIYVDTTSTDTCCYEDCHRTATDLDSDGDEACALHAAQSERYVEVTDLSGEAWLDEASAERAEALLAEAGWDITIRAPRSHSEIQATYLVTSGGLQILGHSIPVPEPLQQALREAAEQALEGA